MKWFFIIWMSGVGLSGPYDTQDECLAGLSAAQAAITPEEHWYGASGGGICVQAITATAVPIKNHP
jgi:hypothetical protein